MSWPHHLHLSYELRPHSDLEALLEPAHPAPPEAGPALSEARAAQRAHGRLQEQVGGAASGKKEDVMRLQRRGAGRTQDGVGGKKSVRLSRERQGRKACVYCLIFPRGGGSVLHGAREGWYE